jgi:hypothetical protein
MGQHRARGKRGSWHQAILPAWPAAARSARACTWSPEAVTRTAANDAHRGAARSVAIERTRALKPDRAYRRVLPRGDRGHTTPVRRCRTTMSRLGIVFRISEGIAIGVEGTPPEVGGSAYDIASLGSMMSFKLCARHDGNEAEKLVMIRRLTESGCQMPRRWN